MIAFETEQLMLLIIQAMPLTHVNDKETELLNWCYFLFALLQGNPLHVCPLCMLTYITMNIKQPKGIEHVMDVAQDFNYSCYCGS